MVVGSVPAQAMLTEDNADMQQEKCKTCRREYDPSCDYRQGRCPHHPPLIDVAEIQQKIREFWHNLRKK